MKPIWRIYYADGSTFDSLMGSPYDAPQLGFVCAVGYTAAGNRYITHGKNHYIWHEPEKEWWAIDWHGILDRVRMYAERTNVNPFPAYKEGRMVGDGFFKEVMNKAHRDPDFPQVRN